MKETLSAIINDDIITLVPIPNTKIIIETKLFFTHSIDISELQ